MVTGINDLDLLKKKKLDKTLPVRLEWVATQSSVVAASTQEIAVTLRVQVEGESTRGGITTLVRGFGGDLSGFIFFIYGCLNLHFNAFWARISAFLG